MAATMKPPLGRNIQLTLAAALTANNPSQRHPAGSLAEAGRGTAFFFTLPAGSEA